MSNASASHSHGTSPSSRRTSQIRLRAIAATAPHANVAPAKSTARQRLTEPAHAGSRSSPPSHAPHSHNTRRTANAASAEHDPLEAPPAIAANLARVRAGQGLCLDQLSAKSGVPLPTLRALEAGSEEPTIKTLWSLANALGVPFSALIERRHGPRPAPRVETPRPQPAADGPRSAEAYEITLAARGSERALPRARGALEHVLVASGYVEIQIDGSLHRLGRGESVSFQADVERRYFNPTAEAATLHLVISEPADAE